MTAPIAGPIHLALALAWAGLGVAVLNRLTVAPARLPRVRRGGDLLGRAGRVLTRLSGRPAEPQFDRRVGAALAGFVVGLPLSPVLACAMAIAAWSGSVLRVRRSARRRRDAVVRELPDVIDLVRLGVSAGLGVVECCRTVARSQSGEVAAAFDDLVSRVDRGARVSDSLEQIVTVHEVTRPLVRALVGAERYGLPLDPALAEVAALARHDRRRRIETASRQVSVRLLFPLVVCVLPAFVLLTVVPSLAGSIGKLTT